MSGSEVDWSAFTYRGAGIMWFIALPIGLLIATHVAYSAIGYRHYSFWNAIKLSAIPYLVIWISIDVAGMVGYIQSKLALLPIGLALVIFFVVGPLFGAYMVQRIIKCSASETRDYFLHWSVANIVIGLLIAIALPNT